MLHQAAEDSTLRLLGIRINLFAGCMSAKPAPGTCATQQPRNPPAAGGGPGAARVTRQGAAVAADTT